jgi:hemerythrin-like domain-containing protein
MVNTQLLRRQHDDALAMTDRLLDLVDRHDPRKPVYPILLQLNRLIGLLRVHLAYEDVELYPSMMASADLHVARTAQAYVKEMGGLAADLESFARHWTCSASIVSNFLEFCEGMYDLLLALAVRIERENEHLYPLVETLLNDRRDAA